MESWLPNPTNCQKIGMAADSWSSSAVSSWSEQAPSVWKITNAGVACPRCASMTRRMAGAYLVPPHLTLPDLRSASMMPWCAPMRASCGL